MPRAVLKVPGELQGLRGQERAVPLHPGSRQELPCLDLIGELSILGGVQFLSILPFGRPPVILRPL